MASLLSSIPSPCKLLTLSIFSATSSALFLLYLIPVNPKTVAITAIANITLFLLDKIGIELMVGTSYIFLCLLLKSSRVHYAQNPDFLSTHSTPSTLSNSLISAIEKNFASEMSSLAITSEDRGEARKKNTIEW